MSVNSYKLDADQLSLQEHVFQRWINHILRTKQIRVQNLYDDLANGIHIVYLVECLTCYEFKSKIKNPTFRTQKMENITMVLKYLQENENIQFLNIDTSNILNKESKLILSFIWHIIEYFSILKPLELYFNLLNIDCSGKSVKQKFLIWLKAKIFPKSIRNLSNDCKDGIVIGALVNSYNSTLCSDWKSWDENTAMENAEVAIEIAADKLQIPYLIRSDELINSKLDEKSLMTYLSQFIQLESGKKKASMGNVIIDGLDQVSYSLNEPINFTITTNDHRNLKVKSINPRGNSCSVSCVETLTTFSGKVFSYQFTPSTLGQYYFSVTSDDSSSAIASSTIFVINNNEYKIYNSNVFQNNNSMENSNDVSIFDSVLIFKGRGIQATGIRIGDLVEFMICVLDVKKVKISNLFIQIRFSDGKMLEFTTLKNTDSIKCKYCPQTVGVYDIIIYLKNSVFQKLFKIDVSDKYTPPIFAFGPGLKHASSTDPAIFIVETNGETGTLNFTIEGPNEAQIECKDNGDGSATVIYWPVTVGEYAIHIFYDDQDISNSPFMVDVLNRNNDIKPSQVKAYGPALREGFLTVNQAAYFTVDITNTNGSLENLFVECYDRFGTLITLNYINSDLCKRNYTLVPKTPIKLSLCISFDGISIIGSPFMIYVVENALSNKIKIEGSGLLSACSGEEALFFVDCRLITSEGRLEVMVTDSNLNQIPCIVEQTTNDPEIYSVKYTPPYNITRCLIEILFNKVSVYDEPFIVSITSKSDNRIIESYKSKTAINGKQTSNLDHQSKTDVKLMMETNDIFKQTGFFPGFSDIFLDPNADSFLKLILPPQSDYDANLNNLPLPPADLIDDTGDASIDNCQARFPLSTVVEESDENYSIRDSIFSSGSHSRASAKEDFMSLSRKSSLTLAPSPSLLNLSSYAKPEAILTISEIPLDKPSNLFSKSNAINQSYGINNALVPSSHLPPKCQQIDIFIPNINLQDISDVDIADNLPFPEPPSESELIVWHQNEILFNYSKTDSLNISLEENESIPNAFQLTLVYTNENIRNDSFFETNCCMYFLEISMVIQNCNLLWKPPRETVVVILDNENFIFRDNCNAESVYVDYKMDNDNSITDVLPVTQMGAIMSPFDEENNYLSDNSSNSIQIETRRINSRNKHESLQKANYNLSLDQQLEFSEDVKCVQRISSQEITSIEHKRPFSKILKEITTSEISEISETSQWLSNEDRMNNNVNEEYYDEHSIINSVSDFQRSSPNNAVQSMHLGNDSNYYNDSRRVMEKDNHRPNLTNTALQQSVKSSIVGVHSLNKGKNNDYDIDEITSHTKPLSSESDVYADSLLSYSFPDPPTDVLKSQSDNRMTYRVKNYHLNEKNKENLILMDLFKKNGFDSLENEQMKSITEIDTTNFNNVNAQYNNFAPILDCYEPIRKQKEVTSTKAISSNPPILIPIMAYNNRSKNYPTNYLAGKGIQNSENAKYNACSPKRKKLSIEKISKHKSLDLDHMGQLGDLIPSLKKKKRSKSSNVSIKNIFGDFARPILTSNRQGTRRSFSQSHLPNFPQIKSSSLSKINSMESLITPVSTFKSNYPTLLKPQVCVPNKTENSKNYCKINLEEHSEKALNFDQLIQALPVRHINDDSTVKIESRNNMKSVPKKSWIKDTTATNVESDYKLNSTSNLPPETINEHLRYIDSPATEPYREIIAEGDGLVKAFVNVPAEILIKTHGQGTDGISLAIEGPSKTEIETQNSQNGDCRVLYIPQSPGDYLLSIQQDGKQILGSPFKIVVRKLENDKSALTAISKSKKASAEGQGLTNAIINFPNQFIINTKEAGPGGLSLSIEGPSKAIIEFKDAKNGICGVTYRVTEPGHYTCIVKFNKKHIRGSPFVIHVGTKPTITAQSKENPAYFEKIKPTYQVGKKALYKTDLKPIYLNPGAKWSGFLYPPSGKQKEIYVNYDEKTNVLWTEFIPNEVGNHWISFFDESNINLSINSDMSFQIVVEEYENMDLARFHRELESIKVFGKGLIKGRAGCSNVFLIEIGESVSGALNVTVDGPSKVEIKCNETENGFKFSYIPAIQGEYLVTIKYGGEHQIKGSPFQVKVSGSNKSHSKMPLTKKRFVSSPISQSSNTELSSTVNNSDISSIMCYGSGLVKAQIHNWMDFYIDASKTKINHLFVGIIGPSEPCEEIRILYIENNRYLISYKPKEKGHHSLVIKWGESHLNCSPSVIDVE